MRPREDIELYKKLQRLHEDTLNELFKGVKK